MKKNIENKNAIAIVGMACRLPRALNKEMFWELLLNKKETRTHYPESRWELLADTNEIQVRDKNFPYWGSYLYDIDLFDANFFKISPREAIQMDPKQRFILEVAYEAILDAGINKADLEESKTGVYISEYASDYLRLLGTYPKQDALEIATGNAISIAANRISYQFDLHGPSLVVDTACSSSLVAASLACDDLNSHRCDTAIVGGVTINLLPSSNYLLAEAQMLSPEGRCKTFSANADGYEQGEGAVVLILKRLSDAIRDKDRIYASIIGKAINQDGASNGLTAPNGISQEQVLQEAYQDAEINPNEVVFVETHGTGTFLGDPIEVEALGNVLSAKRSPDSPCVLGASKTNVGHLEAAAGVLSLMKAALSIYHNQIPANLHFDAPNPHIDFKAYQFIVPTESMSWPENGKPRIAGVSSFGFGGTNAHMVLQEAPTVESRVNASEIKRHVWQHKSYWISAVSRQSSQKSKYPLNPTIVSSDSSKWQIRFDLTYDNLPEIFYTQYVLHVGYYLEMLTYACKTLFDESLFHIQTINFNKAVWLKEQKGVSVHLFIEKKGDTYQFGFYSATEKLPNDLVMGTDGIFILQKSAIIRKDSFLEDLQKRCLQLIEADAFYQNILDMEMPAGRTICWVQRAWHNKDEIICELNSPVRKEDGALYKLTVHPGLVDACVQPIFQLLTEEQKGPHLTTQALGWSLKALPTGKIWLYYRINREKCTERNIYGSWILFNDENQILIECEEQCLLKLMGKKSEVQEHEVIEIVDKKAHLIKLISGLLLMPKEDIQLDSSILDLGMNSLMIMDLKRTIEIDFGRDIPIDEMMLGPTIQEILVLIDKEVGPRIPASKEEKWFPFATPKSDAKIKLFCFPYGAGGASIYRQWSEKISPNIEVIPVQLPGRENRINENPYVDLPLLIDELTDIVYSKIDGPFAFYGHSLGALIAFELSRSLRKKYNVEPVAVFAAAFTAPQLSNPLLRAEQNKFKKIGYSSIPDPKTLELNETMMNQFIEQMVSSEIQNEQQLKKLSPELLKSFLSLLLSDLCLVQSYTYSSDKPLKGEILALGGALDGSVSKSDLQAWAEHTSNKFNCVIFDKGGHLFVDDQQKEILKLIEETLLKVS